MMTPVTSVPSQTPGAPKIVAIARAFVADLRQLW